MVLRVFVSILLLLPALGCGETNSLFIEVRTDFVPGVEFHRVETALLEPASTFAEGSVASGRDHTVGATDDFIVGVRVAEFGDVPGGVQRLRVRLVEQDGRIVTERAVSVTTGGALGVTLVLARDCAGVECPLAGDDATAIACVGGACALPECTVEMPDACPRAECVIDSECPTSADACAEPRCEAGVCLSRPREGACGSGLVCHPDRGCVPTTIPMTDGGIDSSVDVGPDSAVDASVDSGDSGATDAMAPLGVPNLVLSLTDTGEVRIDDLDIGEAGSLLVVGAYNAWVDLGDGRTTLGLGGGFTASYDGMGNHAWSTLRENNRVMSAGTAYRSAVAFAPGTVVMAGGRPYPLDMTNYQTFIHVHDLYGGETRATSAQDTEGADLHLGVATDGTTVCAVGTNQGDMTFDGRRLPAMDPITGHYFCMQQYSPAISHFFDFPDESEATAVAVVAGTAYVAGRVFGVTSLGGTPLGTAGAWRTFVWAFDATSGTHRWARDYDTSARPTDFVADPDGGDLFLAGDYDEAGTFGAGAVLPSPTMGGAFAVRLAPSDGAARWAKTLDLPGRDRAGDIAVKGGHLYAVTTTNASVTPNARLDIVRLSDGGSESWSSFGGTTRVTATGVAVDAAGTVYVAGVNEGAVTSPAIPHAGTLSTFLVAYR